MLRLRTNPMPDHRIVFLRQYWGIHRLHRIGCRIFFRGRLTTYSFDVSRILWPNAGVYHKPQYWPMPGFLSTWGGVLRASPLRRNRLKSPNVALIIFRKDSELLLGHQPAFHISPIHWWIQNGFWWFLIYDRYNCDHLRIVTRHLLNVRVIWDRQSSLLYWYGQSRKSECPFLSHNVGVHWHIRVPEKYFRGRIQ